MNPSNPQNPYRGRIAPSPTGWLHLGHARTFYTAFLRAQAAGGELYYRDEDLDFQRCRREFSEGAVEDLKWLGIHWQGEIIRQSERLELYHNFFNRLKERKFIYPCTCSRKDVAQSATAPHSENEEPIYPGTCRPRKPSDITPGAHVTWRFRVPDGEAICFDDGCCGLQSYVCGRDFGDFIVWRQDDLPAYQLAVVVDDALMGITEVVRGADLLVSTARQLLLYRALEWNPPRFYHCPLVTDRDGKRLAKRSDALSIRTLRSRGVTPKEILSR